MGEKLEKEKKKKDRKKKKEPKKKKEKKNKKRKRDLMGLTIVLALIATLTTFFFQLDFSKTMIYHLTKIKRKINTLQTDNTI